MMVELGMYLNFGDRRHALRAAICCAKIVVKAAELGELEERTIIDWPVRYSEDGLPIGRTIKAPREEWFKRIAAAYHAGAFARLTDDEIVDRILTTPAPAQGA